VARSIRIGKRKKLKNIITAFRYTDTQFEQRPSVLIDTSKTNLNSKMYLSSAGFSITHYYKDQYIFRFGANEDIPEGFILQFLYGLLTKEKTGDQNYTGADVSYGKHFNRFGYISMRTSLGTFLQKNSPGNSTLNMGLTYYSDLIGKMHWHYRQFIYMKYVTGFNKPENEKINLTKDELYGLSLTAAGKSKIVLNLESVIYTPYNFIGFRFAPLALIGFGMLSTPAEKLFSGNIFQSYALGLLIRNENLLTNSFEITYGFYPSPADGIQSSYKYNPVTRFTVKFRSFSIEKPSLITYE
jgi:hypothetical protein